MGFSDDCLYFIFFVNKSHPNIYIKETKNMDNQNTVTDNKLDR